MMGILAALTKPPFFMSIGLLALFYVARMHRASVLRWAQLVIMGALSSGVFILWWRYGNHWSDQAEFSIFTSQKFTGADGDAFEWWFGGLARHFSLKLWIEGGWHWAIATFGSLAFAILPIIGCIITGASFLRWWMTAAVCTTFVCANIVLVHWHYFFLFAIPSALLAGVVAERLEREFWKLLPSRIGLRVMVLLAIFCPTLGQGLERMHLRNQTERYTAEQAAIIREHTADKDKLVVWRQGWGV